MAANDILFGIFVYVVSCISTAIGQESEYLKDDSVSAVEVCLVR